MEKYTGHCNICDKRIKHERNWIRHCKSKGHIKRMPKVSQGITEVSQKVSQGITKPVIGITKVSQGITKVSQGEETEEGFKCKYCDRSFPKKNNMYRHQKNYCKERPQVINNNTTNNITNNTINYVVQVHVHGQQDFSKCFSIESIPELLGLTGVELLTQVARQMYDTPENMAISCPNIKNDFGTVKRIEGLRTEYIPPVLKDVIDRLPLDLRDTLLSIIQIARENGYYKEQKKYAIDDKKLVVKIYNEMIKACHNPKERKEVVKTLKALFHNNKFLNETSS